MNNMGRIRSNLRSQHWWPLACSALTRIQIQKKSWVGWTRVQTTRDRITWRTKIYILCDCNVVEQNSISCCGGLSRLTVSCNRVQNLKFSCLAEFGLRKGMQMVNTVLEDQKLLIQYLSNISWFHSFTKYKQPISIMHWTQYSKRWPWLRWWGEQAAFGLRWYQSGHHDIGGYAVCILVVHIGHWLLCTCAHCAHWSPLIARESHFRQLDLATLLLVRFPDPLADALWVRRPCNS